MDIGEVLSKAWKIIWRHKVLWIFGIFAGCGSAGTGSGNAGASYQTDVPIQIDFFENIDPAIGALLIGLGALLLLILIGLVIFLGTIGQVALINGTQKNYKDTVRLTFGELFRNSTPYFWRVFGLKLLVFVLTIVAIIGLVLIGVVGSVVTLGLGLLCLIPFLCLLGPIIWALGIYIQQAILAIVIENVGIMDGLRRGWDVFRDNLGQMLALGIILFVINLLVGIVMAIPFFAVVAPFIAADLGGTLESLRTGLIVTGVALICYIPVFMVIFGVLRSYTEASWTLNYLRLTGIANHTPSDAPVPAPA